MRRLINISSTLADSAAAAAGSFLVGLTALRVLESTELALYALLFAAGVMAMVLPQQMSFFPRRIRVNTSDIVVRARYSSDFLSSVPHFGIAVLIVIAAGVPLYGSVNPAIAAILSISACCWVIASTFQDHVRISLHITRNHRSAAATSGVQLLLSGSALVASLLMSDRLSPEWLAAIPFTALAISNALSAVFGIAFHRKIPAIETRDPIALSVSIRTATSGFLLYGSNYLNNLVVAVGLGSVALAQIEGSRIAAQPVMVAASGLSAFFIPTAVRLQKAGDTRLARRRVGQMAGIQLVIGGAYATIVPLFAGLLAVIAERPIDGALAAALAVAFALQSTIAPLNQMNIAAGRYALAISGTAVSVMVSISVLLASLGPLQTFAVPLAIACGAVTRAVILLIAWWRRD